MTDLFRTDNIGLVAYLQVQKIHPVDTQWENRGCYWYFEQTLDLLKHEAAFYDESATGACAQPRVFARALGQVRYHMHKVKPEGPTHR